MQILTSLNDLQEAEEILQWLKNNRILVTLEGQLTHTRGPYIPNGLGIYVLNPNQFQDAKRLLGEFDRKFRKPAKRKQTLFGKIKAKKLDKLIVALCTAALTVFLMWLAITLIS